MGTPQILGVRKFAESGDGSKLSNRTIQKWILPPKNQVGECRTIPLTSLLLFTRITFFQTYHPKKAIFDGFYTDLGENNSFWEKIADIPHAVRCPSI